jgi:hypothetical protein
LVAEGTAAVVAGFFFTGAGLGFAALAAAGFFGSGFSIVAVLAAGFGFAATFRFAGFGVSAVLASAAGCSGFAILMTTVLRPFFFAIFTGVSGAPSGRVFIPRTGMTDTGTGGIEGGRSSSSVPGPARKFGIMAA